MYGDEWPLRVTGIASAAESEWRIGQQTPERTCEGWLLVYVKSGMVEELCDTHRVLLRAGQILFHQPAELFAMRAVGEVPPEVFRVEFTADGSAMDSFRSCHMRLGNAEKSCLRQLAETVREVFQPVQDACQMPARRAEIPFGGKELQTIYLAQLPFYWLLMLIMGVAWGLFSGQVTAVSKDFYQLVRSSFTALMWLSGIFYQISNIKGATLRFILRLNPITYLIDGFRYCFIDHVWFWEEPMSLLRFMLVYLLFVFLGVKIYSRTEKTITDVL